MNTYHIYGIIHPERAPITFSFNNPLETSIGSIYFSIINNQLYVELKTEELIQDIFTLKNTLKDILQEQISIIGYIFGYAYDVELIRMVNLESNNKIDQVFGIDIPSLNERNKDKIANIGEEVNFIYLVMDKYKENAHFIRNCFSELNKAIRFPIDTGFHCYRGLESLRHFVGKVLNLKEKSEQWEKLRELSNDKDKEKFNFIMLFAKDARHGEYMSISSKDREKVFSYTWDMVDKFLESLRNLK